MLSEAALLSICLKIKVLLCKYSTYQEIKELRKFIKRKKWFFSFYKWFEGKFGGNCSCTLFYCRIKSIFLRFTCNSQYHDGKYSLLTSVSSKTCFSETNQAPPQESPHSLSCSHPCAFRFHRIEVIWCPSQLRLP